MSFTLGQLKMTLELNCHILSYHPPVSQFFSIAWTINFSTIRRVSYYRCVFMFTHANYQRLSCYLAQWNAQDTIRCVASVDTNIISTPVFPYHFPTHQRDNTDHK